MDCLLNRRKQLTRDVGTWIAFGARNCVSVNDNISLLVLAVPHVLQDCCLATSLSNLAIELDWWATSCNKLGYEELGIDETRVDNGTLTFEWPPAERKPLSVAVRNNKDCWCCADRAALAAAINWFEANVVDDGSDRFDEVTSLSAVSSRVKSILGIVESLDKRPLFIDAIGLLIIE